MNPRSLSVKENLFRLTSAHFSIGVFILLGFLAAFNHSLWRDEMQGWLVAWNSNGLYELWMNNAPSGHPIIWSVLIFVIKDLTGTPLSMQLMHWFLGCLAIIFFWKWSPFPKENNGQTT